MAAGASDPATLDRYARAQAELEHHGGYLWRDRRDRRWRAASASTTTTSTAASTTFSGGELTRASLARALATAPGPAAARRADQPPRHRVARVARADARLARRGDRPGRPRPLVPRDRRHRGARARGRALALLRRDRGTPGAPSRPRASWRSVARSSASRPRSRGSSASSRAGAPGRARARRSRAPRRSRRSSASSARRPTARRCRSASTRRSAAGASSSSSRTRGSRSASRRSCCSSTPSMWLERGEHVSLVGPNGSGKTTLIETLAGQRPLAAGKLRTGHNVQVGYLSQHADELGDDRHRARGDAARNRADAEPGARAARPLPVQRRAGREAAGGALGRRAPPAVARDPRQRRRQRADPRRADQPPRPRVARGARGRAAARSAARCCSSPTTARCSTPSAPARSRSSTARCAATSAAGRSTCACARSARPRARSRSAAAPRPAAEAPPAGGRLDRGRGAEAAREAPAGPSKNRLRDQERAERAVEAAEAALVALEQELSDPAAWATKYETAKNEARHTAAKRAVDAAYAELEALL